MPPSCATASSWRWRPRAGDGHRAERLGWQSTLGTAGLTAVMFLMIPSHTSLNWDTVLNRGLDTVVGCVVALLVGLLFWPHSSSSELKATDLYLCRSLEVQLHACLGGLNRMAPP